MLIKLLWSNALTKRLKYCNRVSGKAELTSQWLIFPVRANRLEALAKVKMATLFISQTTWPWVSTLMSSYYTEINGIGFSLAVDQTWFNNTEYLTSVRDHAVESKNVLQTLDMCIFKEVTHARQYLYLKCLNLCHGNQMTRINTSLSKEKHTKKFIFQEIL